LDVALDAVPDPFAARTIVRRRKDAKMAAPSVTERDLSRSEGFSVESPEGPIGWVEEVWLGLQDEPRALAVKLIDGRRGLLAVSDVTAVVPDQSWVVVPSRPPLLELDAPRLEAGDGSDDSRLVASWATTGAALPPPPAPGTSRRRPFARGLRPPRRAVDGEADTDRVVWHAVAVLYTGILLVVTTVITLAFLASYLVAGRAY
jgi:hypothetical protein